MSAYLPWLLALAVLAFALYRYWTRDQRRDARAIAAPFPPAWRQLLERRVAFYQQLPPTDRRRFEQRMQLFLARTRISGVETDVDDLTRVLVAASAVIPIWGFPDWHYPNLSEVLIVPDAWQQPRDAEAEIRPLEGTLLGSVQGFQNDQYMRLSKAALERGFRDWQNGENVGIHEFAHVLDHADGTIDGAPSLALPPELQAAWADVIRRELNRVRRGSGILDGYAGTNEAELFAVALENFFEDPDRLAKFHPELYSLLSQALSQQPSRQFPHLRIGRAQRRGGDASGRPRRAG